MLKLERRVTKTDIGRRFEDKAACLIEQSGFRIIARNYRCKGGEIDLIAQKGGLIVFFEVKARKNPDYGYSAQFVDKSKVKRIVQCAKQFLVRYKLFDVDIRFDVIAFDGEKYQWIKNITVEA